MVDWPHRLWSKPVSKPKCPRFVCLLRPGSEISTARWKAGSHFCVHKKCECFFLVTPKNALLFLVIKRKMTWIFVGLCWEMFGFPVFFFVTPSHQKRSRTLDSFLDMEFHTRNQNTQVASFHITNIAPEKWGRQAFPFWVAKAYFQGQPRC